jgi:ABC-type antimicrobial peptide transport system permease subunit
MRSIVISLISILLLCTIAFLKKGQVLLQLQLLTGGPAGIIAINSVLSNTKFENRLWVSWSICFIIFLISIFTCGLLIKNEVVVYLFTTLYILLSIISYLILHAL